jgi:alpha-1,3-rhamnosyl/mannosyltransferase
LKIALDARSYFMRTGIARYTRGLVHALVSASSSHRWLLLISDQHSPDEIDVDRNRVEVRQTAAPWLGGATERAVLSEEVAHWGADVFHSVFPPHGLGSVPTLTTVFDFSPISHPDVHQEVVRCAFREAWASAAARSRGFVTISAATRRQLAHRIRDRRPDWIVPCALSAPFNDRPPDAVRREGVLFVGTIEPRKNIGLLLDAARLLAEGGRPVPLTIIGKRGWGYPEFEHDLARTRTARWLGFVDDATLLHHYRTAPIVAFPSLLEGFGLPVLEAMAQEALPLVAPDEALTDLVNEPTQQIPLDAGAWAAAIARWLDDRPQRQMRAHMAGVFARRFTWSAAADTCLGAYEALATMSMTERSH